MLTQKQGQWKWNAKRGVPTRAACRAMALELSSSLNRYELLQQISTLAQKGQNYRLALGQYEVLRKIVSLLTANGKQAIHATAQVVSFTVLLVMG